MADLASRFDEEYYLGTWWDVRQAVQRGQFASGYAHWQHYGQQEQRAHRWRGDASTHGSRKPVWEILREDPEKIFEQPFLQHQHRGFTVRCCMEEKSRARIAEELRKFPGGVFVECGVLGGATLLSLAQEAQQVQTTLFGVDPWEKSIAPAAPASPLYNWYLQMRRNLELVISELKYEHIHLIQDFSASAADRFQAESIDFAMIDGDHSAEAVRLDLEAYWPKIKKGGLLMGDDFDWPEVRGEAEAFARRVGATVETWNVQFILRKHIASRSG